MARYQKPVLNLVADNVWGAACQAQRINGSYVKLSILTEEDKSSNKLSNRQMIETFMVDSSLITEEAMEQGKKVRAFYQALTFKILQGKQLNDFDNTAMLIANRDVITSNYDVAVIASLPSCYERGVKRQTVDQRINFARGGFIGQVGKKVSTSVEVLRSVYSQTYNVNFVTGINSDDQAVFFAYKKELEVGKMYDIYGNVKAHRDTTTQLNRVKVIA
jgi:catabolite regulation protein CreA